MAYDRVRAVSEITAASLSQGRWPIDNDPSTRYPIYTRANIGEVFPDVVRPFSWTLWGINHSEPGWRQALINLGAFDAEEFTADRMEMLSVFGGYGYLNVSASRIFGRRAPGLSPEGIDASFFGEQPDVPPYLESSTDASPKHEERLGATIAWVLSSPELPELLETRAKLLELRDARPALEELSDSDLLDRCLAICEAEWEPLWVRHIMATYHSMIPSGVIAQICASVALPQLAADILAVAGEVDSALPAKRLWRLSRMVHHDLALQQHFADGIDGLRERIHRDPRPSCQEFRFAFEAFINEFGFRGPNEWEVASRCWEQDPSAPLSAIDIMRRSDETASPDARMSERGEAREEALQEVRDRLSSEPEVLTQFNAAVSAAAVFFAARERTRTNCALLTHEMRMPMWELGRRYVERGQFAAANEFSMLLVSEWQEALASETDLSRLIEERANRCKTLEAVEPPFIVAGEVPDISSWRSREGVGDQSIVTSIVGQPGCAGVSRGPARIVHDPANPGELGPGDILIARHTDPSWTPLFSAVSGVVVDVGATVSHAVIVARELGVPCVTSATDATRLITDGAIVEVDGGAGTVTIIDAAAT
ncbi:MAG: PEP-utilizing enzyme [Pseudomonadota bacterium]